MDRQDELVAPPHPVRGLGGEDLAHVVTAFGLVFAAGFAVVAFVLLSRRRKRDS